MPTVPLKTSDWWYTGARSRTEGQSTGCYPKGINKEVWAEEVMATAVDEGALQPSTCPLWKKRRAVWQIEKVG